MMLPPIGFFGSEQNMAAPSTWATTWLVMMTATPNCKTTTDREFLCLRHSVPDYRRSVPDYHRLLPIITDQNHLVPDYRPGILHHRTSKAIFDAEITFSGDHTTDTYLTSVPGYHLSKLSKQLYDLRGACTANEALTTGIQHLGLG